MKKRVISALLVGMLAAFILQQSVLETPSIAAAMESGNLPAMGGGMEDIPKETDAQGEAVQNERTAQGEAVQNERTAQGEAVQNERTAQGEAVQNGESAQGEAVQNGESFQGEPKQKENAADTEGHDGQISGSGPATSEGTDAVHTASRPGGEPEAGTEDDNAAESAPGDSETEQEESEYANLAIAQVSHYVNVRQEPNTESEILGKIYNGAVAQIQAVAGEEQDWFQVISGNVEGYIKSEYFLYGDEAVEAVDEYVTRYAAVTVDRLNVRQEPSTDSRRIGYAGQGEKLKLLEQQGDWMLVQYTEDQTGYVAAEYVTVSEEFLYAKSIEEERAEQEAQRELARRMAEQEQAVPENTVAAPLTPPAAVYTSNEELRRAIVDYAMLYLGYPYVHGGRSLAGGTDCSGFTCYIYADFGYSISRTPSGQYSSAGRSIDYSEIQPGDIICYGKSKCTHVGMYIGDGQIIHAANSRKGVVIYDAGYDTILDVRNVID